MKGNESSILTSLNYIYSNESKQQNKEEGHDTINNYFPNNPNINEINSDNKEKEEEELDDFDNLRYKDEFTNSNLQKQEGDSVDASKKAPFKFSIDLPNVPKQRLHEYLNDDLLNALEVSPSIPYVNNGIQNTKVNENDKINNNNINANSLFGFSLYPINVDNFSNNNNLSDFNIHQNQPNIQMVNTGIINNNNKNNNNNKINNINNVNIKNAYNFNNINNYNINNEINGKFILDNQSYMPIQMRNNDQNIKKDLNNGNNINKYQKNKDEKNKNKFDGKKNAKKEGKLKKKFEVRVGDWNCSKCSNLNFAFRSKCNRCGLPKEISEKSREIIPQEMNANQNINYQMMGSFNQNNVYLNNRNEINDLKFYHNK